MRKTLTGLLLIATAASPALADKGGKGGGHSSGGHGHEAHGGGDKHGGKGFRGGGGGREKHADRFTATQWEQPRQGGGYRRFDRFQSPARVVRIADDKHARKAWKHELKQERRFARPDRFERVTRIVRYVPVEHYVAPRPIYRESRYYDPAPVQYRSSYAVPRYEAPIQSWGDDYWPSNDEQSSYWPSSYGPLDPAFAGSGQGLLGGGGNGILGALLPIVLQSVLGGDAGGFGGLGGLAGLGGGVDVLPLRQASYAPYASNGGDLASLLGQQGGLF